MWLAVIVPSSCGVEVSASSDFGFAGAEPPAEPGMFAPPLTIQTTVALPSSLSRPIVTAAPPPPLQCLEDAGSVALTRSRCPHAPPGRGACEEEGLDCLYPVMYPVAGECALAFECALGVWTPTAERCPGPEVSLDVSVNLEPPAPSTDAGNPVSEPSDAGVNPADAALVLTQVDAANQTDAAPVLTQAPSTNQADAAAVTEADTEPPIDEGCPSLAPVAGSPCGVIILLCSYAPTPVSSPTRAFNCACGRWYEFAPSEVSR
jgi:hypothetical protein